MQSNIISLLKIYFFYFLTFTLNYLSFWEHFLINFYSFVFENIAVVLITTIF